MAQTQRFTRISGFAGHQPDVVRTTEETVPLGRLPRKLDFKRITRIEEHREVGPGEGSLEMGLGAARKALARAGVDPADIGLVISGSVSQLDADLSNQIEPCYASTYAGELGLEHARTFDVINACSGMMTGLLIADAQIKAGTIDHALIISGEYVSAVIGEALRLNLWFNLRAIPSLTVGDGGAAYVISVSDTPEVEILEPMTFAQFDGHCIGGAAKGRAGPMMRTRGKELQDAVLEMLPAYLERGMRCSRLQWSELDHLISHQTTPRAVEKGSKVAREAMGDTGTMHRLATCGNTASTSHGIVLENLMADRQLKSGETAYLMSFGSGLVFIGVGFRLPQGVEAWS